MMQRVEKKKTKKIVGIAHCLFASAMDVISGVFNNGSCCDKFAMGDLLEDGTCGHCGRDNTLDTCNRCNAIEPVWVFMDGSVGDLCIECDISSK